MRKKVIYNAQVRVLSSTNFFLGLQTPDTDVHLKMVSEMFPGGVVIDINRAQKFIIQGKVKEAIPLLKVTDRGWNNFVKGSKNTLTRFI